MAEAIRRLVEAWNGRDAEAFGALFTPAAEYVTGAGRRVQGRPAIAMLVEPASDSSVVEVTDGPYIELGDASANARFGWSTTRGNVSRRGTITCRLAWHGTGWLVEALHNTESG